MSHATRSERREVKAMGASVPLYRRARRAGATHDEVLSVLQAGRSFWRYELFRSAGASHAAALALESDGVDAISYRDLRRIGVVDDEVSDARRRNVPLDVYFSARRSGLGHSDAAALVDAGFRHAAGARAWRRAARARELLESRDAATQAHLALVVRRTTGFRGGAGDLVDEIVAGEEADGPMAA